MLNGYAFEDGDSGSRPAVVDGEFVWLPTLAGLLRGESGVESTPKRDLWSTLTAAAATDQAMDQLEQELADGADLAELLNVEAPVTDD